MELKHLSAAVLLTLFDDLADETRSKYVYAAFFETDYCYELFELCGLKYDKFVIDARIAQRPRVPIGHDDETYTQRLSIRNHQTGGRKTYTFNVDNGYITRISRNGELYRLRRFGANGEEKECSYIADSAFDRLRAGVYHLCEGV